MTIKQPQSNGLNNPDESGNDEKTVITRPGHSLQEAANQDKQGGQLPEPEGTRLDSDSANATGFQAAGEAVISREQSAAAVESGTGEETVQPGEKGLTALAGQKSAYQVGTGTVLKNRFELLEVIGAGGMGTVYKALDRRDIELGNSAFIAIKVLNSEYRSDPDVLKALHSEARKTQQLAHPNIITVYDFDRDQDVVFMTMEFMQGVPLNKVIAGNPNGMPTEQALPIIEQMGEALAYAHSKLVIHSDFKPANVFIDRNDRVKVLDFGIARIAGMARTPGFDAGILGGLTLAYASLEMLQGKPPDVRDDIYALACVAYELLTGRHPYERESAQQAKSKNLRPLRVASLNRRQWAALSKALRFDREDRTANVRELLGGLHAEGAAGGGKTRLSLLLGASVLLLALGISAWYWHLLPLPEKDAVVNQPETQPVAAQQLHVSGAEDADVAPQEQQILPGTAVEVGGMDRVDAVPAKQAVNALAVPAVVPAGLHVSTDRKKYRIGDEMVIRFTVEEPLYVRIAVINSLGEISELFPNDLQRDYYCQPGTNYRIPPADSDVSLFVRGPVGSDRIIALAGRKRFSVKPEDFSNSQRFIADHAEKQLTASEIRYRID